MRNVVLFIAMSLDGYIADRDGNVGWLQGQDDGMDDGSSYDEFVKGIDTVVLGWKTYHQVMTELSPEEWPYHGLSSYVFTHRKTEDSGADDGEDITFVNQDVCTFIRELKQTEGKDIWICGGAAVARPLVQEQLIDRFHISIIPVVLGNGIRLFGETDRMTELRLVKTQSYNGIVDVIYEQRNK